MEIVAQASHHRNLPLEFRQRLDQFWQTVKPELDIAKQLRREILLPELAFAQSFPLFRWRVRPAVSPHDEAILNRREQREQRTEKENFNGLPSLLKRARNLIQFRVHQALDRQSED